MSSGERIQKKFVLGIIFFSLLIGIIGFVIGYFSAPRPKAKTTESPKQRPTFAALSELHKQARDQVSTERLQENLNYFAGIPHLGGTNESYQQALHIRNEWIKYGLDKVELKKYSILLSYPKRPGIVALLAENGAVLHKSAPLERVLDAAENDSRNIWPYNAYSPSGDVEGKLVYVNYGRSVDFQWLKSKGINCTGKIAIARYGKLFRGDKAKQAQLNGAIGLIIYSDPADYAKLGINKTYPDYEWLSSDGVQRGNLWMLKGDPLTPGYPATDGIYRIAKETVPFPKIPVQPISWRDAEPLLRTLTENAAPSGWQGKLGFQYGITMAPNERRRANVNVSMSLEMKPVYNVIGTITGRLEPDRYVILGNHRDSWNFGAADAASGTAAMMEVARVMGNMITSNDWRPRRSIMFASWGAEEFGIMGSGEWVEEHEAILGSRAVAYLNVDISVMGNHSLRAKASPLLNIATFEAAKTATSPNSDRGADETVYDVWLRKRPVNGSKYPSIGTIGGGSDFLFFAQLVGVPCVDMSYSYDPKTSGYAVYHTLHDTIRWLTKFVDPEFKLNKATTQVWMQLAFSIADSDIIPFDPNQLAAALVKYANDLRIHEEVKIKKQNLTLVGCSYKKRFVRIWNKGENPPVSEYLQWAIGNFSEEASRFMNKLSKVDEDTNDLVVRGYNDQLLQLERAFINNEGLPGRPSMRNLVFAPSMFNLYASSKFPGITDAVYEAEHGRGDWEQVKKHISMVLHAIRTATSVLRPPAA